MKSSEILAKNRSNAERKTQGTLLSVTFEPFELETSNLYGFEAQVMGYNLGNPNVMVGNPKPGSRGLKTGFRG